jgi:hypothetical protein
MRPWVGVSYPRNQVEDLVTKAVRDRPMECSLSEANAVATYVAKVEVRAKSRRSIRRQSMIVNCLNTTRPAP